LEQQVDELIGQTLDKHWTEELPIKVAVTLRDELCKFVRAALAQSEGRVAKAREEALEELRSECRRVVDLLGPNPALVDDETRGRADAYASIGRQIDERLRALRLTAPGRETK